MRKIKTVLCFVLCLTLLSGSASAVSMKKGSSGALQYFLEQRLAQLGYDIGDADGAYDAKTADAVKKFQQDHGLKASGTVNDATWEAMFSDPYRLGISTGGIGSRTYYLRGRLAPPFTAVKVKNNPNGADYQAVMNAAGIECLVTLAVEDSLDAYVKKAQESDRKAFDDGFVAEYGGKSFKVSSVQKTALNGKQARIWSTTWEFTNGEKLVHYAVHGIVELDEAEGKQLFATAVMHYNLPPTKSQKEIAKLLSTDAVTAVLDSLRCGRDRLTDYEAGAAKRKKASKLKLKLPVFQPVEEDDQGILEMLYEIWQNVNPAADGASGELDANTCVSLYYGVKIMQRYVYLTEHGYKPSDALTESVLDLGNGVFDNKLSAAFPEVRGQLSAAMTAARLALTDQAAPYLVLLGLDAPRWTEEDLDNMSSRLIGAMDRVIERRKQQGK